MNNETKLRTPYKRDIKVGQAPDQDPLSALQTVILEDGVIELCGGSGITAFSTRLLNQTTACISSIESPEGGKGAAAQDLAIAIAAALMAFKPADEIEGMLAAQAVSLHNIAMECFRRSMLPNQPFDVASKLRKDGTNMARAMIDILAALDRKRGKGRQHIIVERVVVHEGGQAIVGAVSAHSGREQSSYHEEAPFCAERNDIAGGGGDTQN